MGKNFGLIPSIFFLIGYLDQLTLFVQWNNTKFKFSVIWAQTP